MKKYSIAPAPTEAETNKESVTNYTTSKVIKVAATSGEGAILGLINQLYDNGLISKECYIAIEAAVAEHMNCSVEDGE